MSIARTLSMRPRLAVPGAVALVALALLVIPVSYDKVTGHEIALTVSGPSLDQNVVRNLAGELKSALGEVPVRAALEMQDVGTEVTLTARVPAKQGDLARRTASAFARSLSGKGYAASAEVTPLKTRVSGNVYAMAADRVIRVEMSGKTAEEIEREITAQLEAAGIPNTQVSVTRLGDDRTEIRVLAESDAEGTSALCSDPPEIVLTQDGTEFAGEKQAVEVRVKKVRDAEGVSMVVTAREGDREASATVLNPGGLDDAALAGELARQFAEQGMHFSVSVQDGEVRIACLQEGVMPGAAAPEGQEASWGKVKTEYKKDE